ncbi:cysteine-rich receptor-like protein kinase 25 [Quercus suber]|uniref:Cysteine-rich receptor-like protein kinase 25 n=1 Tax=Quercus suber TaxID=58331 RepID=A0AAW0KUA0_QUESU
MTYYYFFSLPILLLIFMLSVLSRTSPAYGAPEYLAYYCLNISTIPENSSYQSSLSSLLSSISLYASSEFQFYSPTSSLTSSLSSNAINKLTPKIPQHLRPRLWPPHLPECVATAAKSLALVCSRKLVALIWYDECIIRYSNESFFSTMNVLPGFALSNIQNITELHRFDQLVNTMMIDLESQASEVPAGSKKFKTKEANFSELKMIYSLVQCTPDLSTTDCNTCLQEAIGTLPVCCNGKQGANVLMPSCYVRLSPSAISSWKNWSLSFITLVI